MERKEFIKKFTVGGSILLTAPVLFNACSDDTVDPDTNNNPNEVVVDLTLPAYSELGTIGGSANNGQIIIIRTGNNSYLALSNICTHQQCTVGYNHASTELVCPCHGSKFNTSGSVKNGPAATSLKSYTVKIEGNTPKIT